MSKNKKSQKNLDEDRILDEYIKMNINSSKETDTTETPLSKALDEQNKLKQKNLKDKLKQKMLTMKQMKTPVSKKDINREKENVKNMMKHPKMNKSILELYGKAIAHNPSEKLPTPIEILDNQEKYKAFYYKYILTLVNSMKNNNMQSTDLDIMLNNPFAHYMAACLECPVNPFSNLSSSSSDSTDLLKKMSSVKEEEESVPELINCEEPKLEELKSEEIKSEEIKSEEIKSEEIKSEEIKSEELKSEELKLE